MKNTEETTMKQKWQQFVVVHIEELETKMEINRPNLYGRVMRK